MFGVVAALFGPVKYAMLPDQLTVGELATGNALVEGATFMAILIGTIAGGQLVSGSTHMGFVSLAVVGLAFLSWGSASRIPHTAPSASPVQLRGSHTPRTHACAGSHWFCGPHAGVSDSWNWMP